MQITIIKLYSINKMCSYLILFEIRPDSPAFVIGQCVSVFLEKGVDTGDSSVPRVFQVFKRQSPEAQNSPLCTLIISALTAKTR